MRILILADHMWRDVPALCAVQVQIERLSEHHVCISDIHLFPQLAELFKPNLVVIPHLHDGERNKIVDSVRRRGGLCAVLPNEGRPNTVGQTEWVTQKFPAELCDLFLCWTEWLQDQIGGRVPTVVTGCPRFDFYYRPVDKAQILAEYGLTEDKPIITVASSFPQAKFHSVGGDFLVNDWKNLGVSTIKGFENPKQKAYEERVAQDRFSVWLSTLKVEYPDFQILLKPHPAEDVRYWQQIDINLMLSDYVTNLLTISDVHIARVGCLTIPEAWIAKVPTVQCHMGPEIIDGPTADSLGWQESAQTSSELTRYVEDGLTVDGDDCESCSNYVSKYLGPMPGSAERVAVALVDLLKKKNPTYDFEFTHQDHVTMNRILMDHNRQYRTPTFDYIGQWGKSVVWSRTQEQLSLERAYNEQENQTSV